MFLTVSGCEHHSLAIRNSSYLDDLCVVPFGEVYSVYPLAIVVVFRAIGVLVVETPIADNATNLSEITPVIVGMPLRTG